MLGWVGIGGGADGAGPAALTSRDFLGLTWWDWLSGPSVAMLTIIALVIWVSAGGYMLLFLAGLQNISADVYEAASIDGASRWRTMRSITIPLLRPTLFTVLTLGSDRHLAGLRSGLHHEQGQPGQDDPDPGLPRYDQSINNGQWGSGTAMSFVLFAIIIVFTAIQSLVLRDRDASTRGFFGRLRSQPVAAPPQHPTSTTGPTT